MDVVLIDQHNFPRDKTCGDGLIPDSPRRTPSAWVCWTKCCAWHNLSATCAATPPAAAMSTCPAPWRVLPRKELDHILVRAAVAEGARLHTPLRFESVLKNDAGRAIGARFRRTGSADRETRDIHADHIVIATGAQPQGLVASGLCERQTPSAIACAAMCAMPKTAVSSKTWTTSSRSSGTAT